ncbi:MAG: DUF58 domain-containing protein [Dehalococcoidia bacterium]|nr:DUF58 domain-containing protein [Dehalococcoidia bacterium]
MRSLFGELWVQSSVLFVVLGLNAGSVALVGLGVLIFGAGGLARLGAMFSLDRVRYTRVVSETRAFVGESLAVRLRLANEKRVPVPWVEVREQLPAGMPATGAETHPSGMSGAVFLTRGAALGGREALEWQLTLHAVERGFFRVGPTRLRSGDLFGLFEREETVGREEHLIVYPRTYALPDLGLGSARPFGEQRGGQRIFEDPVRVVGVRDYVPGDPLKRIDWNATARVGRLQSRLYEPSRAQSVVVALNISTMEFSWQGFDPVVLERSVVVAASIAREALEAHSAIGLVANGSFPDADRPIRIGSGRRPDQLVRVLEALAMIAPYTTSRLSEELGRPGQALPAGATIVVVAALMPPDLAAALRRLSSQGHSVHIVKTSAWEWGGETASIPVTEVEATMRALEADWVRPATGIAAALRGTMTGGLRA